jgi:hypothetical protein
MMHCTKLQFAQTRPFFFSQPEVFGRFKVYGVNLKAFSHLKKPHQNVLASYSKNKAE